MSRIPRKTVLASACALAIFSSQALMAQDAPTESANTPEEAEKLDAIEVTGLRYSIATSVDTKSESTSIVEAISAEDIGKLPDLSIAESLARLPGLAGQRVDGRAQVIAIRGLSPDFAATLLNGREQISTGDNRGVEFDQYPSELINAVTVYKTPDAALVGQGLSGTVNLQTVRPLDIGERRVVFNARGEYNTLGEQNDGGSDMGYRISASYIDQFMDDTLGVAIGFARLDSPFQEQHYKAWWWADTAPWGAPIQGQPENSIALMGAEAWARSREQVRDGLMAVLEYRPSDEFHTTLDVYYSDFDQSETTRGMMWSQDPWTGNGVYYTDAQTSPVGGDQLVTGGTVHNLRPVVRNDYNTRDDKLYSIGWNNEWKLSEDWSATADLYFSGADRDQSNIETYAGILGLDTINMAVPVIPAYPTFTAGADYADPATILLSDPANWGREGRLEIPKQEDRLQGARLAVRREFLDGAFSGIDIGFNYSKREKDKSSQVYFANLRDGATSQAVGGNVLVSPTSLGFVGIPGVLGYDVLAALDQYYDLTLEMSRDDLRKDFTVTEKVGTGYAKLDIDTDLTDGIALRGNVGVQMIHTDQSSSAFNLDANSGAVVGNLDRGTTYNDFLPSLNLVADFGDGYMIRFGAAKTLARARIDDMRAAASAGVDPTTRTWSGGGGNPELEPWRATSYDLSFEKYFGEASYVALAGFYKSLDTYVYTQTIEYDFTGFTNTGTVQPISNIGSYSAPANGDGGWLRGGEFSTALEGNLLSDSLDGFGLLINGSYTESSIKPDGPNTSATATLPGLSKVVANGTFYYEHNGFSARISQRYRSEFRGEITSLFAQRSYTRIRPDRQTDVQLSYAFGEKSSLAGWEVLLQANNITNSPYRTVQDGDFPGGALAPLEYNLYGRQYLLGLSYKM
ncbi:MAG: TonB-dependent receptor [Xanthomonadales bacterium]|nr:TonB-dependent receptor [Xanthomonadales bacterium]